MTKSQDQFYCPHCNHLYEDILDYGFDGEEMTGNFDMQCEFCDEWFNVKFDTIIYFETQ